MIDPLIQLSSVWLLATVFVIAAWGKLAARDEFEGVVANYRLLPARLVRPFARALPWAELVAAMLIVVPATRTAGAAGLAGLLVTFAAAMAANILRGRVEIDCGCFRTAHRQYLSWWLIGRNAVLLGFAACALLPGTGRVLNGIDLVQIALAVPALLLVHLAASGVFLPRLPTFDENFAQAQGEGGTR